MFAIFGQRWLARRLLQTTKRRRQAGVLARCLTWSKDKTSSQSHTLPGWTPNKGVLAFTPSVNLPLAPASVGAFSANKKMPHTVLLTTWGLAM